MNRKSKVIVSIVGITIVLLALLGITYAYYLTRIEGNTNTNSISITTADLKLVYSENSPEIITENNIMPGTTIGEKTFTVSNTGNTLVEDYKVVLEYAVIEGVVPSVFVRPQDFEITLTCVSKNIETNEVSGTCRGYTGTWNNESFEMTLNDINAGIKHEYTLTIFYANPDIDQSDDMGKNLNLKVQIYGANETSTITGTINNVDETYAMKLNSNPKISTIKKVTDSEGNVKYQYKFIGVEHNSGDDSHTLTLVNKSNEEQSTGNITIKKGTNSNIDGSTITVKDNQTNIYLTTGSGSTTLTNTATFNPYSDNTNSLAYHIINNSIIRKNGTLLVDTPPTKVAEEPSSDNWDLGVEENVYFDDTYVVTYGESHDDLIYCHFGGESGNCETVTTYRGCTDDVKGKYVLKDDWITYDQDTYYVPDCENGKIVTGTAKYEKVLSTTQDNYGTSYYFRGMPDDNYVTFSNMCWRIVRIQGDGSIKLTFESQSPCSESMTHDNTISVKYWGYTYENGKSIGDYNDLYGMKKELTTWLNKTDGNGERVNITTKAEELLKTEEWCLGNTTNTYAYDSPYGLLGTTANENLSSGTGFYYETGRNLYGKGVTSNATLKCNGETDSSKIGALTADEVVFAGGKVGEKNYGYYLTSGSLGFWTLSLGDFDSVWAEAFYMYDDGIVGSTSVEMCEYGVTPAVTLNTNVKITSGEGTLQNPYIIDEG